MKPHLFCSFLTVCLFSMQFTFAQGNKTDTILPGNNRLQTQYITTGLKQYLVYFQSSSNSKVLRYSLWMRNTSVVMHNTQKLFAVTQHWYSQDTSAYRYIYSLVNANDFSPVYHAENIGSKTKAYNWYANHIAGADTVANNQQSNFNLAFDHPVFNWNLDMETYEALPLAAGKTFAISFYDAGLTPPEYEILKVTGSEVLTTLNGQKEDCWILATGGNRNGMVYSQRYWLSKKNHEMLKEEDHFGSNYRYKIKMPAYTPDVLKRFAAQ